MACNMTRIISKFKSSSYWLLDGSPLNVITRRGYCATQAEEVSTKRGHQQKSEEDQKSNSISTDSSWVPDPITGYYKPSTHTINEEIINKNDNKSTNKP